MSKRKYTVYPFELKLAVVNDLRSGEYGYYEIIEKYQLGDPQKRTSTVKRWERIYLEEDENPNQWTAENISNRAKKMAKLFYTKIMKMQI